MSTDDLERDVPRIYCSTCGRPLGTEGVDRPKLRRRDDALMTKVIGIQTAILLAVLGNLVERVSR